MWTLKSLFLGKTQMGINTFKEKIGQYEIWPLFTNKEIRYAYEDLKLDMPTRTLKSKSSVKNTLGLPFSEI